MHRMGGVRSVKFSLAGNSVAIAAATEREGAHSLLPAARRKFWSGGGNLAVVWIFKALTFALENIPL